MRFRILFVLFFLSLCSHLNPSKESILNFKLLDTEDREVEFYKLMEKKELAVVFFGYTHCPNICYNVLNKYQNVSTQLENSLRDRIDFIFISIDPNSDTKSKLLTMKKSTDPRVLFLRGNLKEIEAIKNDFGIKVYETKEGIEQKSSLIHSTTIFLIDKNHKIINKIPGEIDTEMIVKIIINYLNNAI